MPGEDGLAPARHLRERYAALAIIMLTSAATVIDRVVGLEVGADDYVPKPFDPRASWSRACAARAAAHGGCPPRASSAPSACASAAACSTCRRTA